VKVKIETYHHGLVYALAGHAACVDDAEVVLRDDPNVLDVDRDSPDSLLFWVCPGISYRDIVADTLKSLRLLYPEKYSF
jgi:hypothetical protein